MNISQVDFSNLINATNASNNTRMQNASRTAANYDNWASVINNLTNQAINVVGTIYQNQVQADKNLLASELEAKGNYFNELLQKSIDEHSTIINPDGTITYSEEVMAYKATWLDDVNAGNYSGAAKRWASKVMNTVYNSSDEYVRRYINAQNVAITESANLTNISKAVNSASSAGDFSIAEKYISDLQVSDQKKAEYMAAARASFDSQTRQYEVDRLASSEGVGAAYKYIDGLSISIEEKDTLKNRANGTSKQTDAEIQDTAKKTVSNMLAQGESWGSIYKQSDNLGLTPYQKKLWDDQVSALQSEYVTDIVAPYLAKLSTSTPDEIAEMKTLLEQNKHMFVNMEGTYETYMAKLDSTYTASTKVSSTELKNGMNSWYYKWEAGDVSAYDAMEGIRSLAINSDSDVVAEMDKLFAKMKNKVPSYAKDTFDQEMKFFTNYILGEEDVSSIKNLKPKAYEEYTKNYAWLYSSMMDWINANPNCTMTQLSEQFAKTRNTFTAKYLGTKGLLIDSFSFVDLLNGNLPNEKDIAAFGEAIARFEDSVPFIYENGEFEWYSSSAQEEFYKMEDYGLQLLNAYGYDVKYANILQVGDNAYPIIVYSNDEGQKLIVERDGTVRGISTEGGIFSRLDPVAPGSSNSETNGETNGEGSTNLNTIASTKAHKLIAPASPEEIKEAQQKADKVADENLGVMDESVMDNMAEDANAVLANKEAKTDKKIAKAMEKMESDIRLTLDMEGDSGSYTDEAIAPYMDEILAYAEKLMREGKSRYEAVTEATRELKNRVNKGNR